MAFLLLPSSSSGGASDDRPASSWASFPNRGRPTYRVPSDLSRPKVRTQAEDRLHAKYAQVHRAAIAADQRELEHFRRVRTHSPDAMAMVPPSRARPISPWAQQQQQQPQQQQQQQQQQLLRRPAGNGPLTPRTPLVRAIVAKPSKMGLVASASHSSPAAAPAAAAPAASTPRAPAAETPSPSAAPAAAPPPAAVGGGSAADAALQARLAEIETLVSSTAAAVAGAGPKPSKVRVEAARALVADARARHQALREEVQGTLGQMAAEIALAGSQLGNR